MRAGKNPTAYAQGHSLEELGKQALDLWKSGSSSVKNQAVCLEDADQPGCLFGGRACWEVASEEPGPVGF